MAMTTTTRRRIMGSFSLKEPRTNRFSAIYNNGDTTAMATRWRPLICHKHIFLYPGSRKESWTRTHINTQLSLFLCADPRRGKEMWPGPRFALSHCYWWPPQYVPTKRRTPPLPASSISALRRGVKTIFLFCREMLSKRASVVMNSGQCSPKS